MPRLVTVYNLGYKFIIHEGLCPYPKHGTLSYRSYSVPDDFKMTASNHLLFHYMFNHGVVSRATGSVNHHPLRKKL